MIWLDPAHCTKFLEKCYLQLVTLVNCRLQSLQLFESPLHIQYVGKLRAKWLLTNGDYELTDDEVQTRHEAWYNQSNIDAKYHAAPYLISSLLA